MCDEGQREATFSLSCAVEEAPDGSPEEKRAAGWPSHEVALVCRVSERCGRIPAREVIDSLFFADEFGGFTVTPSGRTLRAGFFPGDPSIAGECVPRSVQFRTPTAPGRTPSPGGSAMPELLDVRGAVRGNQLLLGELHLTTFTIDLTAYCRAHPERWQ